MYSTSGAYRIWLLILCLSSSLYGTLTNSPNNSWHHPPTNHLGYHPTSIPPLLRFLDCYLRFKDISDYGIGPPIPEFFLQFDDETVGDSDWLTGFYK
ncbi:uncharacterized protein RAG0_02845 [Rhynchosporium agropyri]|uniref:Uncharacterized protein n=1 Tax=Rhynchosporium agropyri TaxID=914238 RepID=A0A1E1K2W4_9HELO|nr:uncharacterized protein RAG0_02845 [Rhynchosporium agropyri]